MTAISAPQPTYSDFLLGQQFYCVLSVDNGPNPPLIFGSKETVFTTKKAARHHAAKLAVQHFQSQGLWTSSGDPNGTALSATGTGIKKRKAKKGPTPSSNPASNDAAASTNGNASVNGSPDSEELPANASFAAQATFLANALNLGAPQYQYTSNPACPNFHDVACFFPSASHPVDGPVAAVRNVFGRKKAKEECARLVVAWLRELEEIRKAEVRAVLGSGEREVKMQVNLKAGAGGAQDGDLKMEDVVEKLGGEGKGKENERIKEEGPVVDMEGNEDVDKQVNRADAVEDLIEEVKEEEA
jgi:hypothetical protein